MPLMNRHRRALARTLVVAPPLLAAGALGAIASVAVPAFAAPRRALAPVSEGPFYPPAAWRAGWGDEDADLTTVRAAGGTRTAEGEHLALEARIADTGGRALDGATLEIWQCDSRAHYRHPRVSAEPGRFDPGFQGFGAAKSDAQGLVRLRTIKPVAYPGRTPHIHAKIRHASFGELTTQLFLAGDAGNARDFLWRALRPDERAALELSLLPAVAGEAGLRWIARPLLTVPA